MEWTAVDLAEVIKSLEEETEPENDEGRWFDQ